MRPSQDAMRSMSRAPNAQGRPDADEVPGALCDHHPTGQPANEHPHDTCGVSQPCAIACSPGSCTAPRCASEPTGHVERVRVREVT